MGNYIFLEFSARLNSAKTRVIRRIREELEKLGLLVMYFPI